VNPAAAYVATVAWGALSAFVPATPVEPYLVGLIATTDVHPVPLGIAAALGQSIGKVVIFLSARGVLNSTRLRAWRDRRARPVPAPVPASEPTRLRRMLARIGDAGRRLLALVDRPALTVPIVLLSAVTGLPPLLITTVYAARTGVSATVFGLTCFAGRSARFIAISVAPTFFL
jgi:membrane protein YqaA with SNARE-associated domain